MNANIEHKIRAKLNALHGFPISGVDINAD